MMPALSEYCRPETACPRRKRREKVHACARQCLPEEGEELYCGHCGFHRRHPRAEPEKEAGK
jgi:hypothetical protein